MARKAKAPYTPGQIALFKKLAGSSFTPEQRAAFLQKKYPTSTPEQRAKLDQDRKFLDDCIAVRDGQRPPAWAETLPTAATAPKAKRKSTAKPKSKPGATTRKAYWNDAVDRALREHFPGNSALTFRAGRVVDKVLGALESEIKQSGRKPPTRGLILRKSGHWKSR